MLTSLVLGLGWLFVIFPIKFTEAETLTVQTMTTTQNELGEIISDWADDGTIKGEIWPLRGNAKNYEMGVTDLSTHKLFTQGTVKSNSRVIAANGIYRVGYVQDWKSHREAVLELIF